MFCTFQLALGIWIISINQPRVNTNSKMNKNKTETRRIGHRVLHGIFINLFRILAIIHNTFVVATYSGWLWNWCTSLIARATRHSCDRDKTECCKSSLVSPTWSLVVNCEVLRTLTFDIIVDVCKYKIFC